MIDKISINRKVFEALKKLAFQEKDLKEKLILLQIVVAWGGSRSMDIFSDIATEKELLTIAKQFPTQKIVYKQNTVLHVATSIYEVGGHTRLIEKWINNANSQEKHSLFLTNQSLHDIPKWMSNAVVQKNGMLFDCTQEKNDLDKALTLRNLASEYEYIVLYTNMSDLVPILAFGTEDFLRPILFYNHADHIFWIGLSIIDMLLELSEDGKIFTLNKRAKLNNSVLSIPIEPYIKNDNITKNREQNYKTVVSMARSFKYNGINKLDFIAMAIALCENNRNTIFFIIGPNKNEEKAWQIAYEKTDGRVNAIGLKNKDEVEYYKVIADLYIDSFPFCSYTSFLEFCIAGVPVLTIDTPVNKIELQKQKKVLCYNTNEMLEKAHSILNNEVDINNFIVKEEALSLYGISTWLKTKDAIINNMDRSHKLNFDFAHKDYRDEYDIFLNKMMSFSPASLPFSSKIAIKNNIKILFILLKNKALSYELLNDLFKKLYRYVVAKYF